MASTEQPLPDIQSPNNLSAEAEQDPRSTLLPSTPPKVESDAASNASSKDTPSHGVFYVWWLEIASCVLMFIALTAIIITLAVFDGHPSPSWPYSISVNSLIAVFLVVLKTSMMFPLNEGISQLKWLWYKRTPRPLSHLAVFDDASRGPYGAFQLLFTQRGLHLASLGAIIALLSLAIDPFTQQVIGSRECPVRQDILTATIPRTANYTATGSRTGTARSFAIDIPMQKAIYNGIYNPADPTVPFECPTGNCTFPIATEGGSYSTVGMCSSCVDVTDKGARDTTSEGCIGSSSCFAVPKFPVLRYSSGYAMRIEPSYSGEYFPDWLRNATVAEFKMVAVSTYPCSPRDSPRTCNQTQYWIAAQCGLYPCVKTYEASINNGKLRESVVKTTPMFYKDQRLDPFFWLDVKPCNQSMPESCEYQYSGSGIFGFQDYWRNFVNGSLVFSATDWLQSDPMGKPDWLLVLWHGASANIDSVSALISRMTDSITNHIRTAGKADASKPALGDVFESKSCIEIQWGWMAMPIALVIFTAVFILAIMVQSRRWNAARDWKGSVWALLFGKVYWTTPGRSGDLYTVESVSKRVEGSRVLLEKGNAGYHFVES